jgi:nucleotide-binding universal stress UspA family protein
VVRVAGLDVGWCFSGVRGCCWVGWAGGGIQGSLVVGIEGLWCGVVSGWTLVSGQRVREAQVDVVDGETVVVGIDGSGFGEEALGCAIAEAARSSRRLVVVHVRRWVAEGLAQAVIDPFNEPESEGAGHRMLERAALRAGRHGVPVQVRLLEGSPAKRLVEAARGAAMLVVATHGHTGLAKVALGSVSEECARHATCPVLLVPPAHRSSSARASESTALA